MAQFYRVGNQGKTEDHYRNKTVDPDSSMIREPEKILDIQGRGRGTKYFVKWKGMDESHNTWESTYTLSEYKHLIKEFSKNKKQVNSKITHQAKPKEPKPKLKPPTEAEMSLDSRKIRTDEKASRKLFKDVLSPPTEDLCEPETMPPQKKTTADPDGKSKAAKSVQPSKKSSPVNRRSKRRNALPKLEAYEEDIYNVQHFEQAERPNRKNFGDISQPISSNEATNLERISRHLPTKTNSVLLINNQELKPEATTSRHLSSNAKSGPKNTPSQKLQDLIKEPPSSDRNSWTYQIESANEVIGHLRRDKSLHLRLRWDNDQFEKDFREVYYPLEVVEKLKPQLVLDYLKRHIKFVQV